MIVKMSDKKMVNIKPMNSICNHPHIEVDGDMRQITCLNCGSNVDPFDWIFKFGIKEEMLHKHINALNDKVNRLKKKIKSEA